MAEAIGKPDQTKPEKQAYSSASMEALKDAQRWFSSLRGQRHTWENHWQELADYAEQYISFTTTRMQGEKRNGRMLYDGTLTAAMDRAASILESLLVPQGQPYLTLTHENEQLAKAPRIAAYFKQVNERLHSRRYHPASHFAMNMRRNLKAVLCFGTSPFMALAKPNEQRMTYRCLPLSKTWLDWDEDGTLIAVFRQIPLAIPEAENIYGAENLPEKLRKKQQGKQDNTTKHLFYQAIIPRKNVDPDALDATRMNYHDLTWAEGCDGDLIRDTGFYDMPVCGSMLERHFDDNYGRSPAMTVLPEVKTVNAQRRDYLRSIHRMNRPAWMAMNSGLAGEFSFLPDHINYGALNDAGNPTIRPIETGGNPVPVREDINQSRAFINESFWITLFQVLVDTPRMTASEALIRDREKTEILSSPFHALASTLLAPLADLEVGAMWRMNMLPPMPPELEEAGGGYTIRYENPFARMLRVHQLGDLNTSLGLAAQIAQIDPSVVDNLSLDTTLRDVWTANGHADLLKPNEDVQKSRQARQQQAMQQHAMQAAPAMASAAKDAATAEATLQEVAA